MRKYSVLTKSIFYHVPGYSGFRNMQIKYLMTSSTQHRPNKLPQMRNISSNNYAHFNVSFILE